MGGQAEMTLDARIQEHAEAGIVEVLNKLLFP